MGAGDGCGTILNDGGVRAASGPALRRRRHPVRARPAGRSCPLARLFPGGAALLHSLHDSATTPGSHSPGLGTSGPFADGARLPRHPALDGVAIDHGPAAPGQGRDRVLSAHLQLGFCRRPAGQVRPGRAGNVGGQGQPVSVAAAGTVVEAGRDTRESPRAHGIRRAHGRGIRTAQDDVAGDRARRHAAPDPLLEVRRLSRRTRGRRCRWDSRSSTSGPRRSASAGCFIRPATPMPTLRSCAAFTPARSGGIRSRPGRLRCNPMAQDAE